MPTYRLKLEYEGTRFHGWQRQRSNRTVAGVLEETLRRGGVAVDELIGSGRTDRGVHALEQVAHLRTPRVLELDPLRRFCEEELPADLTLLSIEPAEDRFHARHDARRRSYLYLVSTRRSAFARRHSFWIKTPLDLAAMRRAAEALTGRREMALYCEPIEGQLSTVVEIERVEIEPHGGLIVFRFVASHFLWKLVRRLTGALIAVGKGELDLARLKASIAPRPALDLRDLIPTWTAPSAGLFLERVLYEGEPQLGSIVPPLAVFEPLSARTALAPTPAAAAPPRARTPEHTGSAHWVPKRGKRKPR